MFQISTLWDKGRIRDGNKAVCASSVALIGTSLHRDACIVVKHDTMLRVAAIGTVAVTAAVTATKLEGEVIAVESCSEEARRCSSHGAVAT